MAEKPRMSIHRNFKELEATLHQKCQLCRYAYHTLSEGLRHVRFLGSRKIILSLGEYEDDISRGNWGEGYGNAHGRLVVQLEKHFWESSDNALRKLIRLQQEPMFGKSLDDVFDWAAERMCAERSAGILKTCAELDDDNTGSDSAFKLAAYWLGQCKAEHTHCARVRSLNATLPSRVIDVGPSDGSQEPFLHETHESDVFYDYLALSHRWGIDTSHILTTTRETLAIRQAGTPLSSMSKTFQDAVLITRRFGVRYLWIDSLCIIQGRSDSVGWYS